MVGVDQHLFRGWQSGLLPCFFSSRKISSGYGLTIEIHKLVATSKYIVVSNVIKAVVCDLPCESSAFVAESPGRIIGGMEVILKGSAGACHPISILGES